MGIMLAGAILGSKRGALAVLLFLALVAIGLPLLSGGRGGLGVFAGPSVGYLVGFPVAAWLVGRLTELIGRPYRVPLGIMANVLGGVLVLNAIGIVGMALVADLSLVKATTARRRLRPRRPRQGRPHRRSSPSASTRPTPASSPPGASAAATTPRVHA